MKKVEAIIRPSKLKAVQRGLKEADMPCVTVIPVKGTGLQKSYSERYRGTEQSMILQTRVMIICVVSDENLEKCIDVILDNASEGPGRGRKDICLRSPGRHTPEHQGARQPRHPLRTSLFPCQG